MLPILPILAAVVVSMVLGFLWYSPVLFGNAWMKSTQLDQAKMKDYMPPAMLASVLNAGFSAWGLWFLFMLADVRSLPQALTISLAVWCIFVGFNTVMHRLFEQKSVVNIAIVTAHDLVAMLVTGTVVFWLS